MRLRRIAAFSRRALLQFRHDRRTLAFVLIMPLLMILIFGYTFGGDVKDIAIEVVDYDIGIQAGTSPVLPNGLFLAQKVIDNFDTDVFSMHTNTNSRNARQIVHEGKAWAAIIFPANFTENFLSTIKTQDMSFSPKIEIYIDASNPTIAAAVIKEATQSVQIILKELSASLNISQIEMPIAIEQVYAYGGGNTRFIDYFAPGVISFAIMMVTTMITIILFVNERRNGTLQRLLVSPASESEIVVGYALAFAVIGIIQSIVVLIAAILLFDISIVGNIFLALIVILLLAFGHQGLGILLSAGAKNELQAIQFIPLILFPSILLAGLFWPIESIPSYLQPLSYIIPLRYGIDAERSIMLRGWGIGEIWVDIIVLVLFALLTLSVSVLLLKRRN
ncbi:ABC-2 family transporter protein [uncultured archaeon]|nr:ABC-2 family transporter protein [uncultured archaeon]